MNTAQTPIIDVGLFGPASVTWKVHGDPSLVLAGLRALFLQAVHPIAMHGVSANSDFRSDPWGRLQRTAEYVATTVYGTTAEAEQAASRVRRMHGRLAGIEPLSGSPYRVDDPELLRWVHCCEVESILTTAVRSGLRLPRSAQDAYYAEQTRSAALVGLDASTVPASVDDMADYFRTVQHDLRVGADARAGARFIAWPPMPAVVQIGTPARPAWFTLSSVAFAMLPRWARRLYGLPGLPTTDVAASAAGAALRGGLLAVPRPLRTSQQRQQAERRLSLTTYSRT